MRRPTDDLGDTDIGQMSWIRLISATLVGSLTASAVYLIFIVQMFASRPLSEFLLQLLFVGLACLIYAATWVVPAAFVLKILKAPLLFAAPLIVGICCGLNIYIYFGQTTSLLTRLLPGFVGGLSFIVVQYLTPPSSGPATSVAER